MLRVVPRSSDPAVLVGTETADDAGVYRLRSDLALVQTVDFFPPVLDDPFIYGQVAAANALSDVYAMGGTPKTALNLVCFPDHLLPLALLGEILRGGAERCAAADCAVVGGHTIRDAEIKFGLAVTGIVHPDQVLTNAGARPGDRLLLTKPVGTGFVTTAAKAGRCPPATLAAAVASMTLLNRSASEVMRAHQPHAVTDITGFGLAGHGLEMALGSGVTIRWHLDRLPLLPGVEELVAGRFFTRARRSNRTFVAEHLQVERQPDPVREELFYDAQTSGGLLIAVAESEAPALAQALRAAGCLAAAEVGTVCPRGPKAMILA